MSIEVPTPADSQPNLSIKTISHVWTVQPQEALRVPAVRELAGFNRWLSYFLNSSKMLNFVGLNGMDQSIILRMNMEMKMSGQPAMPGLDSNAPLFQGTVEAVELSTAALEDSLFEVPKEYTATPPGALIKAFIESQMHPAPAVASGNPDKNRMPGIQAYVPNLSPLRRTEPVLPDAAGGQRARGTVEVLATLDAQGSVVQAEALSGPATLRGPAEEAVKQWKFRPVIRNGHAVAAYTHTAVMEIQASRITPATWRP